MPNSLAASLIVATSVGGSTVDTANAAASWYMETDFVNNAMFVFKYGTPANNGFAPSGKTADVRVNVNLVTGAWSSSNGLSGVASGAGFISFLADLKALRNRGETFSAANIFPGSSQTAWT